MSFVRPSPAEFLATLRLSRAQLLSTRGDFIRHVYRTVLRRECEFDASNSDIFASDTADAWDRCVYLTGVLASEESRNRNAPYDELLDALMGGLGYNGARRVLGEMLKDIYPTSSDLLENLEDLLAVIAVNTQRTFLGPETQHLYEEMDGPLTVAQSAQAIGKLLGTISIMQQDIKDLNWTIREIRGLITGHNGTERESYQSGLLLAILAELQSRHGK